MLRSVRIGVAKVYLPASTTSAVAGFSGGPTLVYTASAVSATDKYVNDVQPILDTTASYYFILAPLGEDKVNGGYTIAAGSPISGPVTVTSGQGIALKIAAADFTSNLTMAGGIMVFMRKNSSNYIPHSIAAIDSSGNDFDYMIVNEPLPGAISYTAAQLQTAVADSDTPFGSRAPYGFSWAALSPTTGGVTCEFDASAVPVSPDNTVDFTAALGRGFKFSFQLLSNSVKAVVQGNAGNYFKYTSGSRVIEGSIMAVQTAVAVLTGNKPWKMVMPPDGNRTSETYVFFGGVTQNQSASNSMPWTKTATTNVSFEVNTTNIDTLLDDIPVLTSVSNRAA